MIKTYNVARVDDMGVELIEVHPYLTRYDARVLRIRMKKAFPMNDYVVLNMPTYMGADECHQN